MKRIITLILLASICANASGFEPFVVSDIRIDGLKRISASTVYSYLPVHQGDRLTIDETAQAIRGLYQTRFFSNVIMQRQGRMLIFRVTERPAIATLNIHGNQNIKTADLRKGLKSVGLAEGDMFSRQILEQVQQELIHQYYNRGKYNVSVQPHVIRLNRNRVAIDIEIREGEVARIKAIHIVGNHTFSDKQIRAGFESGTSNWLSWYTKNNQYSNAKLTGDLNTLQSFYMNRGYANFNLNAVQVTLSPDKRSMYISADVKEGKVYTVSAVHLLGRLLVPKKTIRQLIALNPGQPFNRGAIEASTAAIKALLANIGYAYAQVDTIPRLDKKKHTVDLSFYVKPGRRIYIRRVVFLGNSRTNDQILRREMRQFEGAWYSQVAIDRSRIRLQRLGFFSQVKIDKTRIKGSPDQVDLSVRVHEQSSGSLMLGLGYSQYAGITLSGSISEKNVLGSGNSFSLGVEKSQYYGQFNARYYDPYLTENGIGLGYNILLSRANYSKLGDEYASYSNNNRTLSTHLDVPVTEFQNLNFSFGAGTNRINTYTSNTPQVMIDYQNAIGHKTIHTWTSSVGWTYDTRNSYWAATRGGLLSATVNGALPGSTVQYWNFTGRANHYWPVGGGFVFYLDGEFGYGSIYGHQTYKHSFGQFRAGQKYDYPFWQNYFSGGVTDVRGFQDNSLGPRVCAGTDANGKAIQPDANGQCAAGSYGHYAQPIGGAFKVRGTAEMYLPLPFLKHINTARVALFMDIGNVYRNLDSFKARQLNASYGISLHWMAPIGPLIISLAEPFRAQPGDRYYKERIQFTFGSQF